MVRGVVTGYEGPIHCPGPTRCYRPSDAATRAQVMRMVSLAAGLNDRITDQSYADVPSGHPNYAQLLRLVSKASMGRQGAYLVN